MQITTINFISVRHLAHLFLFAFVVQLPLQHVLAAKLDINPSLITSENYSDNIFLAARGLENSGFITQLNPGIKIEEHGRRLDLTMDYRMQNLIYENENSNTTRHRLESGIKSSVIKNFLDIDAAASFKQQAIDYSSTIDPNNLAPTNNLTDVVTYSISPSLTHNFGSSSKASLRYVTGKVDYRDTAVSATLYDASNKKINAELTSGPRFNKMDWSLSYQNTASDNNNRTDSTFERSQLQTKYSASRKTKLILQGGQERNNFQTLNSNDLTKGTHWGIGLNWRPSTRTILNAIIGERYFGSTQSLSFDHKAKRLGMNIAYTEDFTTSALQLQDTKLTDTTGTPGTNPDINANVYLSKKITTGFTATSAKTTLNVSLTSIDRDSQTTVSREKLYEGASTVTWRPGRRTLYQITGFIQTRDFAGSPVKTELTQAKISLIRTINRDISATFEYSFLERSSNNLLNDYQRNMVTASLTVNF